MLEAGLLLPRSLTTILAANFCFAISKHSQQHLT